LCIFSPVFFIFFSTFIHLHSPSLTFIHLHWNGSKKGVFAGFFEGRRRVGGGILMGHKGQGRKGLSTRGPGTVPHAARTGARRISRAALI
jgi:hypothetical protein